ncbi:Glycosyl hydrolase, BNR repeat precursor [Acidisarcina polymorpha]|uniref:Glycosyl hydrolase, BNR repeat n=1 Tax=Acidisarcina polymorpha TaxID=2211140 RepID=A0A2Z5G1U9_9BACT|nr:hypothetical protein [Acidisarcina polymorpha]AXC12625.1 Glycosyl hydrolase, BNR repeat precursor [Acidisarcina polymorpha]
MARRNLTSSRLLKTLLAGASVIAVMPALGQTVSPQMYSDMDWRLIGPFRGGRAVAVSGIPGDGATFYFGAVDGGIWKTTNAGTTWKPIFDGQPVASIGALAMAPSNPQVLYAGTGETDIRSDLASGEGVYKSIDGGKTWKFIGLKETRQIAKIVVDPNDPDIVYVGALGHVYGPNPERGVYKSTDGGGTWQHILDKGPELGVADLAIAAGKPNELFASLWNAHRPPWSTYAPLAGDGSGLYRSIDAGQTWQTCTGKGLPDGKWGRVGVAVSSDGQRVYALIEAAKAGLYVSSDGGASWTLASSDARLTSRAWYFNRITIDPNDPNTVYVPNVALMGSIDGGKTFTVVRGAPGGDDYHELWVDPKDSSRLLLATDQGTSISVDKGNSWTTWYNQPTAQMYHVITDDKFPYTVYGAQQDSGGAGVLSRTDHGQITPRDWFPASGSESGYFAVDPKNSDIIYVSGSYGTVQRWDKLVSLSQDVSPWPVPIFGTEIDQRKYRDPWTPPLVFSPADKTSLYLGAQYVLRTTDGGLHWQQISPDLTGGKTTVRTSAIAEPGNPSAGNSVGSPPAPTLENAIALGYGTLATVAPSYLDKNLIWAGSDTGVISVTRDGGASWKDVTPAATKTPSMLWARISLIEPSHFNPAVAYAAVNRYRVDDRTPYLFKTADYGKTWQPITAGLSDPAFVIAVREDPKQKGLLYAGTEFGIYVSFDDGGRWLPLQMNLPVTSIRDMVIHGDDLVIATHGRSFWILDDITPLRQAAAHAASATPFLYKPEVTFRIDNDAFPGTPLPPEEPTAENPPAGAILDYYLPAETKSLDLNIYDQSHKLVRHVSSAIPAQPSHMDLPIADRWFPVPQRLETTPGHHRFIWNLAWGTSGVQESDEPDDGEGSIPRGPKVAPGIYTVQLSVDGKPLKPQQLNITMDPRIQATTAELQQNLTTAYKIFSTSLQTRRALAEIDSVKTQLGKNSFINPQLAQMQKALLASIDQITEGAGGSLGLEQANSEITSALNAAESSDRPIPSQVMQVYSEANAASALRLKQWAALKQGALVQFNQQLTQQKLTPIAISAIEHEVYILMTQ